MNAKIVINEFLSTPSARRATATTLTIKQASEISIHALREEGDSDLYSNIHALCISIHALREEGDLAFLPTLPLLQYFYPRPPRGGRLHRLRTLLLCLLFLSTPSARRATMKRFVGCFQAQTNFYPRPPRGGRLLSLVVCALWEISIHALREEGDLLFGAARKNAVDFYPRPPRGGRPWVRGVPRAGDRFLSTPSARRATQGAGQEPHSSGISIHALREEGDGTRI